MPVTVELKKAMNSLGLTASVEETHISRDTLFRTMRITLPLPEDWTFTPRIPVGVCSSDVAEVLDVATTLQHWVESRCEPDCGICADKRKTIEELRRNLSTPEHEPAWK